MQQNTHKIWSYHIYLQCSPETNIALYNIAHEFIHLSGVSFTNNSKYIDATDTFSSNNKLVLNIICIDSVSEWISNNYDMHICLFELFPERCFICIIAH